MPEVINLTEDQSSLIVKQYKDGFSQKAIARNFGYGESIVKKCLVKHGVTIRPLSRVIGNESKIAYLYQNGETLLSLSIRFNVDRKKLKHVVTQMGVTMRPHAEQQRKYKLKEDFFDRIDCEEKAYFLGLMYADGHNEKSGRGFSLALQLRDKHILETFKASLEYNGPLMTDSSNANVSILHISSVRISARLSELGCVPRKSLILIFPDWILDNLLPHFIRGYIDGDGWITGVHKKGGQPVIGAMGTTNFIEKLSNIITDKTGVRVVIRAHGVSKGIDRALISGAINCRKLADYLYQDATVFLTRKKDRADLINPKEKLKGVNSNRSSLTSQQVEDMRIDRAKGLKRMDMANKYQVSLATVDRVIYNLRYF